jgi:hypothetical protein
MQVRSASALSMHVVIVERDGASTTLATRAENCPTRRAEECRHDADDRAAFGWASHVARYCEGARPEGAVRLSGSAASDVSCRHPRTRSGGGSSSIARRTGKERPVSDIHIMQEPRDPAAGLSPDTFCDRLSSL